MSDAKTAAPRPRPEREQRFSRKMSDAEALMWNVEKDPWLNPSGGMVTILDRPIDADQFRRAHGLRGGQGSPGCGSGWSPGFGRLSPPVWATDPEFDLGYHLRHIRLPAPGTVRQLFDLATRLYEDPYDRTRPLWVFTIIDGLEGGRGAIFTKLHHSITDGVGAVRLSELYMEAEREAPLPPEVDLHQLVAEAVVAEEAEGNDGPASTIGSLAESVGHLWRRQAGIAQRTAGELAIWSVDPGRAQEAVADAAGSLGSTLRQLQPSEEGVDGGSPLWGTRSRRRHLEALRLPLDDVKAAGKALGGSVNDVFVAGAVNGALAYHDRRDAEVEALNISFVISTRDDKAVGGNSFTPTPVQVPGGPMTPEDRFREIRDRMAAKRESVSGEGALAGLAGLANLLPTSMVTQVARSQAAKMDFATSNLRAAPFTTYMSGAEVVDTITMGPVAGTAFNLTTISYDGNLHLGFFIDPAAVADPADLRDCMAEAYTELLAAGGVVPDEPIGGPADG